MLHIVWDGQNGMTVPEGRIKEAMPGLINKLHTEGHIRIGQMSILNALRIAVKCGEIDHKNVDLVVGGESIRIFVDGRVENWPDVDGFCVIDEQLALLLE